MCEIKNNYSLKDHNTFNITAKAKYFTEFESLAELQSIIKKEIHKKEKFFILGGGSNILLTSDFDGIIIKNNIDGICITSDNDNEVIVEVGAGVNWHSFVLWSVSQNLSGIENLALIPGTVGASPVQNIGAYGMEVKDSITKVTALEITSNTTKVFENNDCNFEYRNSIFKTELKNQFIITKVEFKLSKTALNITNYGAIQEHLTEKKLKATPKNICDVVIDIRTQKLPNHRILGNSGSFFKNPIISTSKFNNLKEAHKDIVGYKISETQIKVAAGWLIDNAGYKGYRKGDAGVHKKQALVLVNYGNASGKEIITLSQEIQHKIKEKYNISIEPEVNIL